MARELIELGARRCPSGKILRKGYLTKKGIKVTATCVPDTGAPGKTPAAKRILPKPKPGALKGWAKRLPTGARRRIVAQLNREQGCRTTIRDLTLIRNLTPDRETKAKLKADTDWLRRQDFCKLKTKNR